MTTHPLASAESDATTEAAVDAAPVPEERAAKCPGVGEYGHGLTGRIVHWGCCGGGPAISSN